MSTITFDEFAQLQHRYQASLRPTHLSVLLYVAKRVAGKLCARISIAEIAQGTGLCRRTVQYARKLLARIGALVVERIDGELSIFYVPALQATNTSSSSCAPAASPVQTVRPIRLDSDVKKYIKHIFNLISGRARSEQPTPIPEPKPAPPPPPTPPPAPAAASITKDTYPETECAALDAVLDMFAPNIPVPKPPMLVKKLMRLVYKFGRNGFVAAAFFKRKFQHVHNRPDWWPNESWGWFFTVLVREWSTAVCEWKLEWNTAEGDADEGARQRAAAAPSTAPTSTPAPAQQPQTAAHGEHVPAHTQQQPRTNEDWEAYLRQVVKQHGHAEADRIWAEECHRRRERFEVAKARAQQQPPPDPNPEPTPEPDTEWQEFRAQLSDTANKMR